MSLQNPDTSIPTLPLNSANNYKFKFVGEGAANIVFEVVTEPQDENRSIFQGEVTFKSCFNNRQAF